MIYFPLLILASFGFCAFSGMIHVFPTSVAPGIRSLAHRICILLLPIPHFLDNSVVDKYFIDRLSIFPRTDVNNTIIIIIVFKANKVNGELMSKTDSSDSKFLCQRLYYNDFLSIPASIPSPVRSNGNHQSGPMGIIIPA